MPELPTGTVTFLFSDMEGSTRLLQQLGERYASVLADCRRLLRAAFEQYHGHEVDTQGDAFFVAFARASDGVAAAVAIQCSLADYSWPQGVVVRVRIGLHTGEPILSSDGYIGIDVHQAARIMSAGHGGQILLSQTTHNLVEQHLPAGTSLRDLGEHHLKDLQRSSHLFQLSIQGLPADFPPLKTLDTHPNNLPIQPTLFIGREKEVAGACELLRRTEVRLLTLTGPAGVGKTRLSLQVAAELAELFANGVFLVPLASVNDAEQVVLAIIQTLGISDPGSQAPLTLLKTALKNKHLLLLLDNFEQVEAAAVQVAELLAVCPQLKILVTSRVVLHVQAEREFAVPPLSVPNPKRLPDLPTLTQYEAVALFIARAQAVKPNFEVTNANAPAVAGICARLDGLPLAIELAAARIKYFPPQTLLTRLEQGLAILAGGARDLPARQQTLRGAIAWSYGLLTPEEQTLYRRFAVFVDGCTWEAAEQVCLAVGPIEEDILEGLASLVDKSFVRQGVQAKGETRFAMLQTLREFGLERLAEAGETETTRTAHALYYLTLAEEAEPHLREAEQISWLNRLEQEHENLRAALSWLLERARLAGTTDTGPAEQALRLCAALYWFWFSRGYIREGWSELSRALAVREGVAISVQARVLFAAGELAFTLDDLEGTEILCGQSLLLYRQLADTAGMAASLSHLGSVARYRGQYALARTRLEEAMALFPQKGENWRRGQCLTALARLSTAQGDYRRAHTELEESLRLFQALGDKLGIGWVHYFQAQLLFVSQADLDRAEALARRSLTLFREEDNSWLSGHPLFLLGQIRLRQGEADRARTLLEESIATFREVENRGDCAEVLISLAQVEMFQGDLAAARHLYQESLAIQQELGIKEFTAACLEGMATVEATQGAPRDAARLWGTAEALREALGTPLHPVYRPDYERAVASARTELGKEAFAAMWAEGRLMPLEQVISKVLGP